MCEVANNDKNDSHGSKNQIESKETPPTKDRIQLKRKVTLLNAITLVAGSIIGSGIFISPKGVYENCGQSAAISLLVWTFCGLFSLLGALCFAELGTTINKSGGEYYYILETYGDLAAFLYLWVSMIIVAPTARAIMALTFSSYLLSFFNFDCSVDERTVLLIAASCLCLLTYVNCVSIKWSMRIQDFFTIAKFGALTVFMLIGIYSYFQAKDFTKLTDQNLQHGSQKIDYSLITSAIYSGLFAFGGWNSLNAVTEELIDPYKNLPRAIVIGTFLVIFFYLTANISYFIVLTPNEILNSPTIGTVFAQKTIHDFAFLMPITVAIFIFGCINGGLFTASRVFYAGAQRGQLPKILAMISIENRTPSPSLIVSCLLSLAMLVTTNVYKLIDYFSFSLWFWTGIAASTIIVLRYRKPDLERPIKYPLLLPILFTSSCVLLTVFAFYMQPISCTIGILVQMLALPFYYLIKVKKTKSKKESSAHNKDDESKKQDYISKIIQKILLVVMPEDDFETHI